MNHSIAFLHVFISGINNQNVTLQKYHKLIFTDLILYKISLIKHLIDRPFKTYYNWDSFHNNIRNMKPNLITNAYPPCVIAKVIKKYHIYKLCSNQNYLKDTFHVHYFKLLYIDNLLHHNKNKLSKL